MPIRILDAATVGRIAAGEVVERPSSVVKELVENSLDAGATAITVEIRGGGIDYLRVTDNGCGIEPGQVRLAFENHATSKLQSADQLHDIRTLGFRGEALPSIASVSHVEMTTRARGQDSGMRVQVDGGEKLRAQEAGCPEGTTFVMRDLFYNIPVRRAFLKRPSYEGGLVSDAVARMMIGNPGVSMRLINNGNTVYHSFGDGKLRHAVFAVYGKAAAEKMVEFDAAEGGTRVYGLIGVGELAKSTRAHELFFINGRAVRCAMLSKTLEQVCRSRVTIGMYPMCALNLVLPPDSIDVNVHPNKLEVRFRDETATQATVEKLLGTAFEGEKVLQIERETAPARQVERVSTVREITPAELAGASVKPESGTKTRPEMPPLPVAENAVQTHMFQQETAHRPSAPMASLGYGRSPAVLREDPFAPAPRPASTSDSGTNGGITRPGSDRTDHVDPFAALAEAGKAASHALDANGSKTAASTPSNDLQRQADNVGSQKRSDSAEALPVDAQRRMPSLPEASERPQPKSEVLPVPGCRIVGVAFRTYIIVEAEDTLLLIDQHAAHERIQYEKYMRQLEAGVASQQLLTPLVIRLSAREMALIRDNLDLLTDAGYEVEPFGDQDIQVRAVPYILGKAELRPLFMEMINSLSRLKPATVDARRAEVMQMACKSAVKGGDALTDSEIYTLIREMLETGAPPTCPHGRPVVKTLTRRDMEKMFKRIQ